MKTIKVCLGLAILLNTICLALALMGGMAVKHAQKQDLSVENRVRRRAIVDQLQGSSISPNLVQKVSQSMAADAASDEALDAAIETLGAMCKSNLGLLGFSIGLMLLAIMQRSKTQ